MIFRWFHNDFVRRSFLVMMSFTYLWAFVSLYLQLPGLYGDDGLLPVRSILRCDDQSIIHCAIFGSKPNILHLFTVSNLNLTPFQALETACLLGIALSSLTIVFNFFRSFASYLLLWYLYFSCFQVGQTFLWFQWDTLLIETGFLTALVAPSRIFRGHRFKDVWLPIDQLTMFLVKWLGFRYIFGSGIVKLNAECPTWWSLTALHYHYESQCIPTPGAWFAHQSSDWLKKLSVVATYSFEIFVPILFFAPFKLVRLICFLIQVVLMIMIIVTGNYNFFNFLTVAICLSLLVSEDIWDFKHGISFKKKRHTFVDGIFSLKEILASTLLITAVVILPTVKLFSLKIRGLIIESEIAFTKSQFFDILPLIVRYSIILGTFIFILELLMSFKNCLITVKFLSSIEKVQIVFYHCVITSLSILMFAISIVPFATLDNVSPYGSHVWPSVSQLHNHLDSYQLVHAYGLFRHMTGVGGRPEVIVYGAKSPSGPWKEYEFLYKVGNVSRAPPIVIPHQPRLDWQMWFAALGSYQHNPWFISLVWKLLQNSPDVLRLMDKNPFPKKPPEFIKADLYTYHFESDPKKSDWWIREKTSEYMPPISLNDKNVENYLLNVGLILPKTKSAKESGEAQLQTFLATVRESTVWCTHPKFIWSITLLVVITWILNRVWIKF